MRTFTSSTVLERYPKRIKQTCGDRRFFDLLFYLNAKKKKKGFIHGLVTKYTHHHELTVKLVALTIQCSSSSGVYYFWSAWYSVRESTMTTSWIWQKKCCIRCAYSLLNMNSYERFFSWFWLSVNVHRFSKNDIIFVFCIGEFLRYCHKYI